MDFLDSCDYVTAGLDGEDPDWSDEDDPLDLIDGLRQTLRDDYADTSDEEMGDALVEVLDAMSPAESFKFASALSQIGKSAGNLPSYPAVGSIARSMLPTAGGVLGTVIGGPGGTALGGQLGSIVANALPSAPSPRPHSLVSPATQAPAASAQQTRPEPSAPPAPQAAPPAPQATPAVAESPVAGGSAAAAQGLVLSLHPQMRQSLLSTALGQQGRPDIGGVPVAQMLAMLSQVIGQAAADADELMYLGGHTDDGEGLAGGSPDYPDRSLYTGLVDADNLELAEALDSPWSDT